MSGQYIVTKIAPPEPAARKPKRVTSRPMRVFAVALLLFLSAHELPAQEGRQGSDRAQRERMSDAERQRMREDMRDAYRDRNRSRERPRELSPQERDKLRQDIQDANRDLRRER
jgi:hypothetical protein